MSQGSFSGIQIDVTQLQNITISEDGTYALFQGGTYDQQVIEYLWERGYVTSEYTIMFQFLFHDC